MLAFNQLDFEGNHTPKQPTAEHSYVIKYDLFASNSDVEKLIYM